MHIYVRTHMYLFFCCSPREGEKLVLFRAKMCYIKHEKNRIINICTLKLGNICSHKF